MDRAMAYSLKGDPGIFSFLGSVAKKGLGLAGSMIPGPIGGVYRGISRAIPIRSRPIPPPPMSGANRFSGSGSVGRYQQQGFQGGFDVSGGGGSQLGCPKGFRPNKSNYFLRDGSFVAAGTKCVRYRRTNVANGKALRKSMRRVEGFADVAKKTISFTKRVKLKKSKR